MVLRAIHDKHEAQLKAKDLPMVVVSARIAALACKFGYRRIICSRELILSLLLHA